MSDKISTSVSLDAENREYLEREVNNRSAFINDLIEAHRQGKSDMEEAIARYRREQLKSELRTVESRKEEIENELDVIREQITEEQQRKEELLEEAKESLDGTRMAEDNPAIERWAQKIGITESELLDELRGNE